MNILASLRAQISRFVGYAKSSVSRVFTFSAPEVYPDINTKTAIDKGFNSNTAVYSIVMKDAAKFGSIPRFVYDKSKYEEKSKPCPVTANKVMWESKALARYADTGLSALVPSLTQLLNRPNEYLAQDKFFEAVRCYYKICGESMIWLNRGDIEGYRNDDGSFKDNEIDRLPVLEMYVLPANKVTIIPDPQNLWGILGYYLEVGQRVYIRKGDVIHWKNTNLNFNEDSRDHLRGMPPLTPGKKALESNNSMTDSSVRMAQNDGARYVLFNESMNSASPTQQSDLKAVIDRKINNNDVKSAVAVLQGKWGGIDLGKSAVDMELLEGKEFTWKELCFLFDVPYEFFDSHTPFAEKQLTMISWITNSISPATAQLDGEMNRVLLKAFNLEGKAFIGCDYTGLPEMKKVAVESAKTMQEIWSIFPNEIREYLGYEKVIDPRFDEPWVPTGRSPLSEFVDDDPLSEEELAMAERRQESGY